ncbi:hypothetical protein BJ322DRAFT_1006065, partial [Thelephora terrestris]
CASNANFTACPPPATGGSWKKSPNNRPTWMPPKGSLCFLIIVPTLEILSKRSPSTMETRTASKKVPNEVDHHDQPSSMISTLVLIQRELAFLFFLTLSASCSGFSRPRPIPANEWIVIPPILHAAIPGWDWRSRPQTTRVERTS